MDPNILSAIIGAAALVIGFVYLFFCVFGENQLTHYDADNKLTKPSHFLKISLKKLN